MSLIEWCERYIQKNLIIKAYTIEATYTKEIMDKSRDYVHIQPESYLVYTIHIQVYFKLKFIFLNMFLLR